MMVSGWLICKACQFSPPLASSYFLSIPGLCVCHSYLTFWRVPDPPLHPVRPFGDPVPVLPAAQVQVLSVIETVGGWGSRDYPMATGDTSFSVIQRLLLRLPGPNPLTSLDIPISSQTISLVCLKPISTFSPDPLLSPSQQGTFSQLVTWAWNSENHGTRSPTFLALSQPITRSWPSLCDLLGGRLLLSFFRLTYVHTSSSLTRP